MTSENLTKNEIIELLSIFKLPERRVTHRVFDDLLNIYAEKNPKNEELIKELSHNLQEYFYNNYYRRENMADCWSEMVEVFATKIDNAGLKLKWFDYSFWATFSFKHTYCAYEKWDDIKYHEKLIKEERVSLVKFLKKSNKDNIFDELTEYCKLFYKHHQSDNDYEIMNYWFSLATKKENKAKLKGTEIYPFVDLLDANEKPGYMIKKAELLSFFGTEDAVNKIEYIKRHSIGNVIVQEACFNILKSMNVETEMPNYELLIEENESVLFINRKVINPQSLIYKKIVNKPELDKFVDLITYYIEKRLKEKGIPTEFNWIDVWVPDLKSYQKVYEILSKMNYEFQKPETELFLKNAINIGVNNLLIRSKEVLSNYNIKDFSDKDKFCSFFDEYIEKSLLVNRIENKLEKNSSNDLPSSDVVIKKHKI